MGALREKRPVDNLYTEWYTRWMNNREKLIVCALELFTARGFDAVGVQEVADAAGLKKPTLYHYFGSKSGLLHTLLSESFEKLFDEVEKAADYQGDVTATLRRVIEVYFEYARRNPKHYRLQLSMWFAPPGSDDPDRQSLDVSRAGCDDCPAALPVAASLEGTGGRIYAGY